MEYCIRILYQHSINLHDYIFHDCSMTGKPILWLTISTTRPLLRWRGWWGLELRSIIQQKVKWTVSGPSHSSHLQCGQRYPGLCPHCPLCWAAIQNGSGTSQTQQVSAIQCQSVLKQTVNTWCDTLLWLCEVHNMRLSWTALDLYLRVCDSDIFVKWSFL